jgi:hypothetical protein
MNSLRAGSSEYPPSPNLPLNTPQSIALEGQVMIGPSIMKIKRHFHLKNYTLYPDFPPNLSLCNSWSITVTRWPFFKNYNQINCYYKLACWRGMSWLAWSMISIKTDEWMNICTFLFPWEASPVGDFPSEINLWAGGLWLTPVIVATWEAVLGRIVVLGHPRQKNSVRPNLKRKKAGCGGVCLSSQGQHET